MKKVVLLGFVLWLLSAVLSLFVVGLLELRIAYASPYTDIDVSTVYNMITNGSYPDLVVLDVRTQSEYDSGHIYGALWIPHTELATRIGELAGHENHEIIAYCRSGFRSANASEILDFYNFTKVYNMLGGILAWQSAGYPVWIATVHNVNTTFNYDTIQAAIDAPQTLDGHTILVDAGTYVENVVVDKSISLIGENRSTTVIDGDGTGNVISITADHVNVTGFTIGNGMNGIFIEKSDYNIISGNIVTDNQQGIQLFATCTCNPASENTIRNNIITNNGGGIWLYRSTNNTVLSNSIITNFVYGIGLYSSFNNTIFHNDFINNSQQVYDYSWDHPGFPASLNFWDYGYPSGGNYWSNYTDVDQCSGPNQDQPESDGIWDHPYVIDGNNQDNYPIIPEFPTWTSVLLILIVLTVAIAIYKRRLLKTPIH